MPETHEPTVQDPSAPPEPLYRLSAVDRHFKVGSSVVKAVDQVELALYPGELVAIEGPSGSGKSTLLQLLGGLDRPTGGSVVLTGRDLARLGDTELTGVRATEIGFVFQSFNLIPTLTASENVEVAMVPVVRSRSERQARAARLLEQVGLAERSRHLPLLLSGGEQQRVAIARAMANQPRVILADEPTGNLDTGSTAEIGAILRSLAADQGVTVIIVTHSEAVASWATRRLRMRDGQLFEMTPEEIAASAAAAAVERPSEPATLPGAGVNGVHVVLFSPEAEALRAQIRDVFGWSNVDLHDGWLIFAVPPAELAVHPGEAHHELSLICRDLDGTLADLRAKGVEVVGDPVERSFGRAVTLRLAGGVEVLLYQPNYPTAI
ncbi:MAG TPA: ATP-binding cassette domain-containing protein [Actinomycetota bacterium]|nr:ATP-binding cassette domain-containing protein [Actinomycetota bacterium]